MQSRVVRLELVNPWRIAHGVSTERSTVILERDGGHGEAAIVPYLGESSTEILAALASFGSNHLEHVRVGDKVEIAGDTVAGGGEAQIDRRRFARQDVERVERAGLH